MKVLITGATGLIGRELVVKCMDEGIYVNYFTTRKEMINDKVNSKGFYWNPEIGEIDIDAFNGVTAIIHLAGATISKRWTEKYKSEILNSRTRSANLIFNSLKKIEHSITHFISSSGVGIYPNSENVLYTEENDEIDTSFLGRIVKEWEEAADKFSELGIGVTKVRTGMVLSQKGGALPKLTMIIKTGLGASIGSGCQWQSWIHIEDVTNIYLFILKNKLEGIYNAVAPNPITNKKLTKEIARCYGAPLWLPNIPEIILKTFLGEMSILVTDGQLVSSTKIESSGYVFKFPNIETATKDLI